MLVPGSIAGTTVLRMGIMVCRLAVRGLGQKLVLHCGTNFGV